MRRRWGASTRSSRLTSELSATQVVKNVLSVSEKEAAKQNNVDKFEIREQNKNKTEAKWKYKVRS